MATVKLYPSGTILTVGTWTDADNVKADDGIYAVTAGSRNSDWSIRCTSVSHSIPAGSTINGVEVEVKFKLSTTASASTLTLRALKSDIQVGTGASRNDEPTTDTVWINSNTGVWTLADIENAGVLFIVRRTSNTACNYSVDYLAITVDYTPPNYDKSGTVSISNGSQETVNSFKSNSTSLQSTVGLQENLASEKVGINALSNSLGDVLSVVGYNSTAYDFESSVSLSDGDVVTILATRHTSSSVSFSNSEQISVAGNAEIPTYDFAVSVNESLGVQENVSGIKSTRASPEMTDGINLDLFGVKSIIAIPSESIGVEKTVSYYKSNGQSISLSNGIRLLVAGTNATTYFCSSTVSLNGGDQTILSGLKQSMFLLAISDGITGSGQGSKATERAVKISAGDIGSFLSTKDSGGLISVYEGVRITVIFKLPYSQLMAVLKYQDRAPLIAHQEFLVSISFSDHLVDLSAADHQAKVSSINRYVKLEVEYVSLQNNTVRLKAEFRDFDGQLVSPDDVVLKLYNAKKIQIGEAIPVLPASEGVFTYDYVLETDVYGSIFYEFSGTVNNLPILGRNRIDITWM
jgi:hypothetical protein